MKINKLFSIIAVTAMTLTFIGCGKTETINEGTGSSGNYPEAHILSLNGDTASLDGEELKEFDYTWRYDPSLTEEKYEGTEPDETLCAYIAHDIIYYPEISESEFAKEEYDGEQEWVTKFTADGLEDYIFGTLPAFGSEIPSDMMHSADEAYDNPVIHITEPGEYIIEGTFNGQLYFDFGEEDDTFDNKEASVTVILNGADVTCSVAPAIVFKDVYECDNTWENKEEYSDVTDLSEVGVNVIIADGTENNFTGCNVYRLLKPEYKKDSTSVQKKLYKTDGAIYSYSSIAINGETNGTGILNITSTTFEGLDSELHMTINGGYINIYSQDDGINVNEDNVSVFTLNGGHLTIFASLGEEGDVIDSNGFIRINGGILAGTSKSPSDELMDSGSGTYVSDSATIISSGSMSGDRQSGAPGDMPEGMPSDKPAGMANDKPMDGQPGEMPSEKPGNVPNSF